MRFAVFAAVLAASAACGRADAQVIQVGGSEPYAGPVTLGGVVHYPVMQTPTVRTPLLESRSGPTVARLHPVIGSTQRTGHFTNPFTHRTGYSETVYNPVFGNFGTLRFRR